MRVHVLDDDNNVLQSIVASLQALGLDPVGFTNPDELLDALKNENQLELLIVDQMLRSRCSGIEVITMLRKRQKTLVPAILITGYASPQLEAQIDETPGMALLPKPFSLDHLKRALDEAQEMFLISNQNVSNDD